MIETLRVWQVIISGIGSTLRLTRQVDEIFRFYVLEVLTADGVFDYLQEPRTYGQILAHFNYVDSEYTRELFNVLANDKKKLLSREGDLYRLNPRHALPDFEKIIAQTDKRVRNFHMMAKGMTRAIPARLRNEPVELSQSFEEDGRQLLTRFDRTLGAAIYTTVRNAAFAYLTDEEAAWLRGKSLLEVGCGSGRETAELWLKLDGQVKITAIDPVPTLLELAEKSFSGYIDEIDPGHPPLTDENRPVFQVASATSLPFADATFDAAFHSLVLHWTPSPVKSIAEIVRVLKPGGLVFGTQSTKPEMNPYFDLVVRTSENSYGFFWREEFRRWYADHGVHLKIATPVGVFNGHKPAAALAGGK